MRATLVWTDPPGNPAAGVKLVNDLDLVITNLDTGDVFYGNDIPAGSDYNQTQGSNGVPNPDSVNNVENVYLFPPLSTNYTVTVSAHRVNVNAVTANTSRGGAGLRAGGVVRGRGDGEQRADRGGGGGGDGEQQRGGGGDVVSNGGAAVGASGWGATPQFAYAYPTSTNGVLDQWKFYVFTNTPITTNAVHQCGLCDVFTGGTGGAAAGRVGEVATSGRTG